MHGVCNWKISVWSIPVCCFLRLSGHVVTPESGGPALLEWLSTVLWFSMLTAQSEYPSSPDESLVIFGIDRSIGVKIAIKGQLLPLI